MWRMKMYRTITGVILLVAATGCSQASSVTVDEVDTVDARAAASNTESVRDPRGLRDPEACLDYPDSHAVSRKGLFELLEQDGWATASPKTLVAELPRVEQLPNVALAHVAFLDPDRIEDLVAFSASPERTPVQNYVVARLRSEWHRFERVYVHLAGPGPWSGVIVIGVNAEGEATFLMDCGEAYAKDVRYIASESNEYQSEEEVIRALIQRLDGDSARAILASRDLGIQWSDLDPDERSLDSELVPDNVAKTIEPRRIWFDVPPDWTQAEGTLCARLSLGWSSCIDLSAARYGPLGIDILPNESVEIFAMDIETSLDGPRQLVGVIRPNTLQRAIEERLEIVLTSERSASWLEGFAGAAASQDNGPLLDVRVESLDVIETWLPRLGGTVVTGEE